MNRWQANEEHFLRGVPWVIVEKGAYLVLALGALLVRLGGLGKAPLLAEEISTALATWEVLRGAVPPSGYSPLLLAGQLPLFWLRASEFAVRLMSALAGMALLLPFWALRDRLGRAGALAAAAFVAFSPGWVFMSRTANGAVVAVALVGAAAWFAWRYSVEGREAMARWAAGFLALSLTAAPLTYTLLTAAVLVGLVIGRRFFGRCQWGEAFQRAWRAKAGWVFIGVLVAASTALWINPAGLGATVALAGTWVRDLAPSQSGLPWYHVLLTLGVYEPLMVTLAGVGLYFGLRRGTWFEKGLLVWLAYTLFLATALGHRDARWLLGVLLPLTLLAARGVQSLAERPWDFTWQDAAFWPLVIGFVGFLYLQCVFYIRTLQTFYLIYGGFGLGLLVLGVIGYGLWGRPAGARNLALLTVCLVLAVPELRGTAALAFDRVRDPGEIMLSRPPSLSLIDFEKTLARVALQVGGDPHEVEILYEEALSPWMTWALREYPKAHATLRIKGTPSASILITGPRAEQERPEGYVGQPFILREEPLWREVSLRQYIAWILFRKPNLARVQEQFWLWVRVPESVTE